MKEVDRYLKPTQNHHCDNGMIQEKAQQVTRAGGRRFEKTRNLFYFVR